MKRIAIAGLLFFGILFGGGKAADHPQIPVNVSYDDDVAARFDGNAHGCPSDSGHTAWPVRPGIHHQQQQCENIIGHGSAIRRGKASRS